MHKSEPKLPTPHLDKLKALLRNPRLQYTVKMFSRE
jgi:hypothetical protein